MFTYLCKIFQHLHARPRLVLALSILATLAALVPLRKLELRMSLADLLPQEFESVRTWNQIGEKFGGLGHLAVVVHSEDSAANGKAVEYLTDHLRNHPDVNILEFRTEAEFYKAHKLLYITLEDLKEVDRRLEAGLYLSRERSNPLIIDLLDEEQKETSLEATSLDDLERKYFSRLQEFLGTPDGKTRVLRIYPGFDVSDIARCRAFYGDIQAVASRFDAENPEGPALLFTGDMMRNLRNEGRLFSGIIDSAKGALILTALLLLLYFFRLPVGALLALVPLAMASVWTLAFTAGAIGHLSLISAPLILLLAGLGLESAVQLLARYREERRKAFSAEVAFETIILETGPAITTAVLVTAAAFFTLALTRFRGFAEFGITAGIGMLCMLAAVLVVYPCLLIVAEPSGALKAWGGRLYNFDQFTARPYRRWRWHVAALVLITAAAAFRGLQFRFQFNFDKLAFPNRSGQADSLVQAAGEALLPPAVVISPDFARAQAVADAVRRYKRADTLTPTIQSVTTMTDLLPADQEEKLAIIAKIRKAVTDSLIARAPEPLRSNLEKLSGAWDTIPLTAADLPQSYRRKFLGRDTSSGQFTFIFPSIDLREGWNIIAFADDVREIRTADGALYRASGFPVVQADLLRMVVPDSRRILLLAFCVIALLVLLDVRSLRGTLVLVLPLFFSLAWTLGFMKVFGIKLNWFNLVAFPALFAYGINNSVHLYHRYIEEGRGSMRFVLRRTGETTAVATLVGMAGFAWLSFSDHRGLATLGITGMLGLSMSLLAPILVMPAVIGYLEERKARKGETGPVPAATEGVRHG